MTKKFEKSLVYVLREQLLSNNTVQLEGIGSFHIEHIKQTTTKNDSGKTVLQPPKDVVVFTNEGS